MLLSQLLGERIGDYFGVELETFTYLCARMRKSGLNIASFLLAALMLVKMLGMPIVFVSFQMNKDYIASELCENRARPQLHCDGQCVLMKKLAKANESNESQQTQTEVKSIGIDFLEEFPDHSFKPAVKLQRCYSFHRETAVTSLYTAAIFHPPAIG